jgi:hypothetical protein
VKPSRTGGLFRDQGLILLLAVLAAVVSLAFGGAPMTVAPAYNEPASSAPRTSATPASEAHPVEGMDDVSSVAIGYNYDPRPDLARTNARSISGFLAPRSVTSTADDLVPDDFVVVRGGTSDVPSPGEIFSGAAGRNLEDAAAGVPHGQIRETTAGQIRVGGGTVQHAPELTRSGVLNEKHVNICLGSGPCPFGPLRPNPVPKSGRIQ